MKSNEEIDKKRDLRINRTRDILKSAVADHTLKEVTSAMMVQSLDLIVFELTEIRSILNEKHNGDKE